MNKYHESVLVDEVVQSLHVEQGSQYIDGTLGNGGHSLEILKLGGKVLGIDLDQQMVEIATDRLSDYSETFKAVNGNFKDVDVIAKQNGFTDVKGIILDLGVTNVHLKDLERGFSFANPEADLDMRISKENQGVKASDLLNVLREDQLRELFEVTLDPGPAKWITGRVMYSRNEKPIQSVGDMLEICEGLKVSKPSISEATLPFLALRIAVNSELDNLVEGLPKAYEVLAKGGYLSVISFHSKEDVIVKDFFKEKSYEGSSLVTFKPITASENELQENRKSRSAKMRVLKK